MRKTDASVRPLLALLLRPFELLGRREGSIALAKRMLRAGALTSLPRKFCIRGVRRADLVILQSKPGRSLVRRSVSVISVSPVLGWAAALLVALLLLVLLAACQAPPAQKGGSATTAITRPGHSNVVTLAQSENPRQPSQQTVQSEQTVEWVLPAGTAIEWTTAQPAPPPLSNAPSIREVARLERPTPVRVVNKDRTETTVGAAQKDTFREWAGKAANLRPVMWTGIVMMTVVAGVFVYFQWWTKAALAMGVGVSMIALAQLLPDHGPAIMLGGLAAFALVALLILYAYHKGQLDTPAP